MHVYIQSVHDLLFHLLDITAAVDEDYRGNRFEVTFPVGSQSVTFDIPIVNDTVFEGPEFFNLSIVVPQEAADMGVEPGIPIDAFVDITDDESESGWWYSGASLLQTSKFQKSQIFRNMHKSTTLCQSVVRTVVYNMTSELRSFL